MNDPLEQLTRLAVPPPPRNLEHGVHQRLNTELLVRQVADLACRGTLYAAQHFLPAVGGLLMWTLAGHEAAENKNRASEEPPEHQNGPDAAPM